MDSVSLEAVKPTELPAPSQGALRVVQACSQQEVGSQLLGQLVTQNPVLSMELLRIANSAYFGFSSQVTSVARAITVIGQRALRNMALCIAMKEALKPGQLPAFPIDDFWEGALRRAVAARSLAQRTGVDSETAFTTGLLQDFGLLVLFYLKPNRISEWPQLAVLSPDDRYDLELQLFGSTHDQVGLRLAKVWELPLDLAVALGHHHQPPAEGTPEAVGVLCSLAQCADWMAAVFTCETHRTVVRRCRSLLEERFGLTVEQTDQLLAEVADQMQEAATALGFSVGEQVGFDAIIREANLRLAEENLDYQEVNWQLQQALEERDRMAEELGRELALAREVQRSLLPGSPGKAAGLVGLNVSAKAVSGDFYDFFSLHTGEIAFCIADVSGKGMNAALLMAKASSLFHCLAKSIRDPAKLLGMLNHEILETSIHGMFVTMVAGIFDPVSRRVNMANAGHLPVLEVSSGHKVASYSATAPPLGILSDIAFPLTELTLGSSHSLYLYTDGLLEARMSAGQRLEQQGLLRLIDRHADRPPAERLQRMVADLRARRVSIEDDITILLVES